MFSKKSLYINILKYKTQLKINYKKLSNDEILEINSSSFIAKDDVLNTDLETILINHSSQINNTYISTLLFQDDTKLIRKEDIKPKNYALSPLNNDYNILVSKDILSKTKNYFKKCGIDYIFSAYHILNLHIEQNICNNNLIILLFNNQAFCVMLNSKGKIAFNKKINITPFDEVKDSFFYENEVLGQRLYDEIYSLELYTIIKDTIEEFYSITKNVFIEKVSLLYNLKLLSQQEINSISKELMIDMTYHPISVDEELYELSKNTHVHKSFIKPRLKNKNRFKNIVSILSIFALILGGVYLLISLDKKEGKKTQIVKKVEKKAIKRDIKLPNHTKKNEYIKTLVLESLELIPYDVVLNELIINKNSQSMDIKLLNKDTFVKSLQPELLKYYIKSNIGYKDTNNNVLEALVKSEGLKNKQIFKFKNYKDTYVQNDFIPIIRVTEQLKMIFPKNTKIVFKSSFKSEVLTFNYLINLIVQKPLEFFELVNQINNELYSINISYPLSFVKTQEGVEIEFTLQFHQPK